MAFIESSVCRIVAFADKSTQVAPCISRVWRERVRVWLISFDVHTHTKHPNRNSNSKEKRHTRIQMRYDAKAMERDMRFSIHFGVCFVYIIYMMFCIHTFRLFSWQMEYCNSDSSNSSCCCCCCHCYRRYILLALYFRRRSRSHRCLLLLMVGITLSFAIITNTCCFACAFIIYVNKLLKRNCRLNCTELESVCSFRFVCRR